MRLFVGDLPTSTVFARVPGSLISCAHTLRHTQEGEKRQARMRQMSLVAVVAVGLVVVLGGTALAQSSNTELGTWKLNVAKSKFSPGTAVKSGTIKVEAAGAGIKLVVDTVGADGTVRHYEYTVNYDGKDSPV